MSKILFFSLIIITLALDNIYRTVKQEKFGFKERFGSGTGTYWHAWRSKKRPISEPVLPRLDDNLKNSLHLTEERKSVKPDRRL